MEISKFTMSSPDSDGDCSSDIEFNITNRSDVEVHQIRYSYMFFDKNGNIGDGNNESAEEAEIKPGDVYQFFKSTYVKDKLTSGNRDDVKVVANFRLMSRTMINLGKIDIPKNESENAIISVNVDSEIIESPIQVMVSRDKPDRSGDFYVRASCLVTNKTTKYFEAVEFQANLFDSKGEWREADTKEIQIPPQSMVFAQTSFMIMKSQKSKIDKGYVNVSLSIYTQADHQRLETISQPAQDDNDGSSAFI